MYASLFITVLLLAVAFSFRLCSVELQILYIIYYVNQAVVRALFLLFVFLTYHILVGVCAAPKLGLANSSLQCIHA